jgi:hypothetical protein
MAARILDGGSHVSLELEEADLEPLGRLIRERYPEATCRWEGIFKVYSFGGCEFTFYDEWDDPCLISNSDNGDALLRSLQADLASA